MTTPTRKYENDLPRYLGIGVAIGLLALLLTVVAYTIGSHGGPPSPPAAAGPPSGGSTGGSSGAAGKQVFVQSGCGGCHTFAAAGTNGTIGPNLATAAKQAKADGNIPLATYLRQSITSPDAYITPGYHAGIMPTYYGTKLTSAEIAQLVSFIASGQTS